MIELRLPHITGTNSETKIDQIQSYLFQTINDLRSIFEDMRKPRQQFGDYMITQTEDGHLTIQ